jgi:hypothetical protein
MHRSPKCLLKIMTLVSSPNIMGIDEMCTVVGRSFIQIRKSKGPKTDPWGTQSFILPQIQQYYDDFSSIFYLYLSGRICTNSLLALEYQKNVIYLIKYSDLHSQKLFQNHRIFYQQAIFINRFQYTIY